MKCLRRLQVLWALTKASPQVDLENWEPEDASQLAQFLKTTSAGAKMVKYMRNGAVESAMRCMTADGKDKALWVNGASAGYMAAIALFDELATVNPLNAEDKSTNPAPSSDLAWMRN